MRPSGSKNTFDGMRDRRTSIETGAMHAHQTHRRMPTSVRMNSSAQTDGHRNPRRAIGGHRLLGFTL
eukprot:5841328-Alexandrium_andersonii.AAC.1